MPQIIPVRTLADAKPVLASERRFAAHRGHPLDSQPCPACGVPLGEAVIVLILAGIEPGSRKDSGWTTGSAVPVHADCAGVPDVEPAEPAGVPQGFTSQWRAAPDCGRCGDSGRFHESQVEAHCTCKRGRRMSELWQAEKHGYAHPDEPEPEYDPDGAPF
jgi:hypothetical protein